MLVSVAPFAQIDYEVFTAEDSNSTLLYSKIESGLMENKNPQSIRILIDSPYAFLNLKTSCSFTGDYISNVEEPKNSVETTNSKKQS